MKKLQNCSEQRKSERIIVPVLPGDILKISGKKIWIVKKTPFIFTARQTE